MSTMRREIIETPEGQMLRCPRCPPEENLWFIDQFSRRGDGLYQSWCKCCVKEWDVKRKAHKEAA